MICYEYTFGSLCPIFFAKWGDHLLGDSWGVRRECIVVLYDVYIRIEEGHIEFINLFLP